MVIWNLPPIITISDIINIVFTYLTLKEIQKQRNLSIMPNITLDSLKSLKFKPTDICKKIWNLIF